MRILSLESSTSAAKALLYDTDTGFSRMETVDYAPDYNTIDGTQDAEGIFEQTVEAGRRVCEGEKVDLIALVGAWHSVMLCDRQGKPATRIYSWAATHAKDICSRIRADSARVKEFYQRTGCMVNAIYPYFKLWYLREKGYDLRQYHIMGQSSYNAYRLTGSRTTSDCMASGSGMLNIHTKRWDGQLLKNLGIGEDNLCSVAGFGQLLKLSEEGAGLLGLPSGTPVIPPCSDGGMNQMAIGGYREGVMSFSVGTSAAIRLTTAAPVLPERMATWCYLSPTGHLSGAATSGACNCISWYKKTFLSQTSFEELEQSCSWDMETPVFLPFLFGERCPGWEDGRLGAFANLAPQHGPLELYQAIREGILFNVYQCYNHLIQANPLRPRIILSGGILNSESWTQMCADIFNHEMEIPENQQSSLWGGVVLGALYAQGQTGADALMGHCRSVVPNAQRHEAYMKKYFAYLAQYDKTAQSN